MTAEQEAIGQEPKQRRTILIVDDDPTVQRICAMVLRLCFETVEVGSAEDAIGVLQHRHVHLVVTDWVLPGLGGVDFLEALRQRFPLIPVVVMTGHSDEPKAVAAVALAQGYLRKPFGATSLMDVVEEALTLYDSRALLVVGDIELDRQLCRLRIRGGEPLDLTRIQYSMLAIMLARPATLVSYLELAAVAVPRPISAAAEGAEVCKHHVHALRTKVEEDPARPRYIRTVRGKGYMVTPFGASPLLER